MPKCVMWTLCVQGEGHKTLHERGADWRFRVILVVCSIEETLSQHISRLEHRIRELEEMTNVYVNLHTGALGSLTQQAVTLMESHTENAVNLSNGVMSAAHEHFDLMRTRLKADLAPLRWCGNHLAITRLRPRDRDRMQHDVERLRDAGMIPGPWTPRKWLALPDEPPSQARQLVVWVARRDLEALARDPEDLVDLLG